MVGATLAEALSYAAGRAEHGRGRWRDADMISPSPGSLETNLIDAALEYAAREDRNGKSYLCLLCQRQQRVRMTEVSNLRI